MSVRLCVCVSVRLSDCVDHSSVVVDQNYTMRLISMLENIFLMMACYANCWWNDSHFYFSNIFYFPPDFFVQYCPPAPPMGLGDNITTKLGIFFKNLVKSYMAERAEIRACVDVKLCSAWRLTPERPIGRPWTQKRPLLPN